MIGSVGDTLRHLEVPIANHLWQSTVFAWLAACLTLTLRKNPAHLRFTVWFAASVKFLLPFALLVRVGHVLGTESRTPSPRLLVSVLEIAGQPFSRPIVSVAVHSTWREEFAATFPVLLCAFWIIGVTGIFAMWGLRWFQIFHIQRSAKPLNEGPEFDCLQLLALASGIRSIPILLSEQRFEPGIFGIVRPVLLWPASISNELQEPEAKAIFAHEVYHVRRHDNLAAAIQMFIEAIFWFHPLVWWLGSRQMDEREHACDEAVLDLGSEPAVYAESILKACKFYVESPLPCVAGVNGSNLKKRIVHIMSYKHATTVSTSRKLVLSSLAIAATAAPVLLGMSSSPRAMAQASSSSISSGPLRITAIARNSSGGLTLFKHTAEGTSISNATVATMIEMAYSVKSGQLTGAPSWVDQDRFDIAYTGGESSNSAKSLVSNEALKEVLAQQFHLVIHQETKPGPMFALVVGSGGTKFSTATPPNLPGTNEPILQMRVSKKDGQGQIAITGGPGGVADTLSAQVGRPIIDRTGLTGIYSINFHWATAASAESISGDLQQQLGLALVPQEGPVETTFIDSVTVPTGS